ncbi:MAG: hypothetical protein ACREGF_02895 [Candidatus Saccharimonadales bacterium]
MAIIGSGLAHIATLDSLQARSEIDNLEAAHPDLAELEVSFRQIEGEHN